MNLLQNTAIEFSGITKSLFFALPDGYGLGSITYREGLGGLCACLTEIRCKNMSIEFPDPVMFRKSNVLILHQVHLEPMRRLVAHPCDDPPVLRHA